MYNAHPRVTQLWYVYDAGEGITFKGIRLHLDNLMVQGPPWGYFLEPINSVLVVSPCNVPRAEAFFRVYRLQIVTGGRYLGGFVGTEVYQTRWLG